MFTYFRSKQDFLEDVKNKDTINSIIKMMETEINRQAEVRRKLGDSSFDNVKKADRESWKASMMKFEEIMRVLDNDTCIAFEYLIDYRSRWTEKKGPDYIGFNNRIDVIVGGYDYYGNKTFAIIEMKQWGGDYDGNNSLRIVQNSDGKEILNYYGKYSKGGYIEDNPAKQVIKYCDLLSDINTNVKNGVIKLIPMVWLFNYDCVDKAVREQLEKQSIKTVDGEKSVNVFFKNEEEKVKQTFISLFYKGLFSELNKGFPNYILHKRIGEFLDIKADNPIMYRIDQLNCISKIKDKIDNNEHGIVYVKGTAGSGKSIVGISILRLCFEKHKDVKYLITEGAPINAYKNSLSSDQGKYFEIATQWTPEKKM